MSSHLKVMISDINSARASKLAKLPVWKECDFSVVTSSADTAEAVKLAKSVTLVICHHEPPRLCAPDLMRAVTSGSGAPLFIVINRYADAALMRECFINGAVDFLSEPLDEQKFAESVVRAMNMLKISVSSCEYIAAVDEFFAETGIADNNDKFITGLRKFLLESEDVTVTTEYAADHFGFNKDYFGRMFKAKLGTTFGDFYNRFRMKYARRLLSSGRYKVYEVSELLGFASVDYFSSVFKKTTGLRPSDLKKL